MFSLFPRLSHERLASVDPVCTPLPHSSRGTIHRCICPYLNSTKFKSEKSRYGCLPCFILGETFYFVISTCLPSYYLMISFVIQLN